MSEDTDFVSMYEELGLDAECGMDAFKQAYRRRVAALHPDMQGDDSDLPRLQRLNRMYEATLDFHRLHGRLPGASAPPRATRAPPRRTWTKPPGRRISKPRRHRADAGAICWPAPCWRRCCTGWARTAPPFPPGSDRTRRQCRSGLDAASLQAAGTGHGSGSGSAHPGRSHRRTPRTLAVRAVVGRLRMRQGQWLVQRAGTAPAGGTGFGAPGGRGAAWRDGLQLT